MMIASCSFLGDHVLLLQRPDLVVLGRDDCVVLFLGDHVVLVTCAVENEDDLWGEDGIRWRR